MQNSVLFLNDHTDHAFPSQQLDEGLGEQQAGIGDLQVGIRLIEFPGQPNCLPGCTGEAAFWEGPGRSLRRFGPTVI